MGFCTQNFLGGLQLKRKGTSARLGARGVDDQWAIKDNETQGGLCCE